MKIEEFFNFWVKRYIKHLEYHLEEVKKKYNKNIFKNKKLLVEEILNFLDDDYYQIERSAIKLVLLVKMDNFVEKIIEELKRRRNEEG